MCTERTSTGTQVHPTWHPAQAPSSQHTPHQDAPDDIYEHDELSIHGSNTSPSSVSLEAIIAIENARPMRDEHGSLLPRSWILDAHLYLNDDTQLLGALYFYNSDGIVVKELGIYKASMAVAKFDTQAYFYLHSDLDPSHYAVIGGIWKLHLLPDDMDACEQPTVHLRETATRIKPDVAFSMSPLQRTRFFTGPFSVEVMIPANSPGSEPTSPSPHLPMRSPTLPGDLLASNTRTGYWYPWSAASKNDVPVARHSSSMAQYKFQYRRIGRNKPSSPGQTPQIEDVQSVASITLKRNSPEDATEPVRSEESTATAPGSASLESMKCPHRSCQ
ncbi:hypothetical protein NUW54_g218 [Trametes sanguinea]|uniref:Uncharacterized protein n=1 Tax=Trametes sanguinea TaxID=158606 RepID=A0ACC1Q9S3_9APHY|nr:hypothetical protein NUW54_g218 [Trametes sanguinea]